MQYALEVPETPAASWTARLATVSWILGLMTIVVSLVGLTSAAIFFGIAAIGVAVVVQVMARGAHAHRIAANIALVMGVVALGVGLQAVYLGTGL